MASSDHEVPLFLLRERPETLVRLLRDAFGLAIPPFRRIASAEADFTQLVPTEYRADLVLIVEGENEAPVMGFVVEPQRFPDPDKHASWPLYAAALHAKIRCPTWLVVLAASDEVARWANQPIVTFQPTSPFVPLVLGPAQIPRITEVKEACALPELAVLSARAHGHSPRDVGVALAAIAAVRQLAEHDPHRGKLYFDMIWNALGEGVRRLLEQEMQSRGYQYQSEFARRYLEEGRHEGQQEGRLEGLEKGRLEGLQEGRLEATRSALLRVLEKRGFVVSPELAARVAAETDGGRLEQWLDRAVTASSIAEVFAGE